MVKKLFALASVTALTGLMATVAVAGCSSTTVTAADTDSGTSAVDSGKTATKPKTDGSADTDAGGPAAAGTCPTLDPIDPATLPWKSPAKTLGACTQKELTDLVTYVDTNSSAAYADWKKTVTGASCSACIFGKESDATWKPLLEDASGQLVGLNVGGCIAIASGNDKCGGAYQNWFDCRFQACADCASGDTAALQKCLTAASKGACKGAIDAVSTICTDPVVTDAENACSPTNAKFVFEGPIQAQCIGLKEGGE